jgi:signal transduction histidine kinase
MSGIVRSLVFLCFSLSAYLTPGLSAADNPVTSGLTIEEQQWLSEKHTVRARVADFPPYQIRQPFPQGLSVDLLDAVAKTYGFAVEYVPEGTWSEALSDLSGRHEKIDMVLTMNRTPEREALFALTQDYLTMPWVIYQRKDSPFISNISNLEDRVVVIAKSYAINSLLQRDIPNARFLEVTSPEEALRAVATGQADAFVGNLVVATYIIKTNGLGNLIVAAPTPYGDHTQAMAIRKDWQALASIIDKGIRQMPFKARDALTQKWTQIEVRAHTDYTLVWQILGISAVVLMLFLYWNRKLDITVSERTRELVLAKEQAEAANIEKSRFLANMSHELRTPMHAILSFSSLGLKKAEDPKLLRYLENINASGMRLTNLLNDLLDMSKLEAGKINPDFSNGDIVRIIKTSIAELDGLLKEKNQAVTIDPDQPISGMFDAKLMAQVFINLLSNAIKFSPENAIIEISCRHLDTNEKTLEITLTDQGIGIPADQLEVIFDPFAQSRHTQSDAGGTGLGLPISRKIIRLHNGKIWAQSPPEGRTEGSAFIVQIPLKQPAC